MSLDLPQRMPSPALLIADDQSDVREALRLLLKNEGMHVDAADSPRSVVDALRRRRYDAVLMDLNYARDTTSGTEGLDLIDQIHRIDPLLPVIVMTAWSTVNLAVDVMQRGARDFIQKPWDNERVLATLRTQVAFGRMQREAAGTEAQRRRDLELAARVQAQLLPRTVLQLPTLECAAHCLPVQEVGGDYCDLLHLDDGRVALVVGDVAGKGVAAALLMANLQALVRGHAVRTPDPVEVVTHVNRQMCEVTVSYLYATLFFGIFDEVTGRLTYVNAGHNPPACLHIDGSVERLPVGGTVLGLFPESRFSAGTLVLEPGARLVIFTDGVTEATNESDEEFGDGRVIDSLRQATGPSVTALIDALLSDRDAFLGGSRQSDDTTVVIACRSEATTKRPTTGHPVVPCDANLPRIGPDRESRRAVCWHAA